MQIDADAAQRRRLAGFIPHESTSDIESGTETESRIDEASQTESQMDTDTETEMETNTEPDEEPDDGQSLNALKGKYRQKGLGVIRNLLVTDISKKVLARKRAFGPASLALYREICETLDIAINPEHNKKANLHDAILDTVCTDSHLDFNYPLMHP